MPKKEGNVTARIESQENHKKIMFSEIIKKKNENFVFVKLHNFKYKYFK